MSNKWILFLAIFYCLIFSQSNCTIKPFSNPIKNLKITEKPITWDAERRKLSLEYIQQRYGLKNITAPLITPTMVVVHWTAIPTLVASFNAFKPSVLEGREELQGASKLNVSAHFLVDRDGTIHRLLPENAFARHTIGLNMSAIGIENVGDGDQHKLTQAQFNANVKLIQYLHYKYPIRYVLGHLDYLKFKDHPLWLEKDPDYITYKTDPGDEWMRKLYQAFEKVGVYGVSRYPEAVINQMIRDSSKVKR